LHPVYFPVSVQIWVFNRLSCRDFRGTGRVIRRFRAPLQPLNEARISQRTFTIQQTVLPSDEFDSNHFTSRGTFRVLYKSSLPVPFIRVVVHLPV